MMTFDVTEGNDIYLGNDGNLALVRDETAVKNCCMHFARALRGEMLHNMDQGMPYWKTTFGCHADLPMFEAAFRERMREISQVLAIDSFSASVENNQLHYTAVISTIYGSITFNV
ncbi:hypothetical protein SAMN05216516_103243 [Izhakiella capsodis]|uniref:Phage related-protein n=1 Tax=Izhakiella capsodis TaxID=1367852 RepID=A0A1I4X2P3_9GAMM|nr:hypothetical protein [Izhakiella capsodis]SFN19912.1 hypothetical protein SAMN05216516_103243 [Izhakiella capsodis]